MRLNNRLKCKICENDTTFFQAGEVLGKYLSVYVVCKGCGFLTVENTFFVSEAYDGNVCIDDAGVLGRNIQLADVVEKIVVDNFDKKGKFLDYAGGCGILVRLMRDKGFDFYLYDPITTNIFARGFEFLFSDRVDLITCFEGFEHFIEPLKELEKMLSVSESILFSTELLPDDVVNYPSLKDWWYYDLKNGQHISFYSLGTLKVIAEKYGLNLYSDSKSLHMFTRKLEIKNNVLEIIYSVMVSQRPSS